MGALALLLGLLLNGPASWAQSITNYGFSATNGAYNALGSGTTQALSGGSLDDGYFNNLPIGFTFNYMGTAYTTVSASTNGWLTFGQNIPSSGSAAGNALASGGVRPLVAPLWDDMALTAATDFSYQTTGSAGSRIFTAEWKSVEWNYNAATNVISFQVKLSEATGAVQFVYSQGPTAVTSGSASIGIAATATGSGSYLSLNGTGTMPTASSTSETPSLSTKPATNQTYTFTPPNGTPATPGLTFTGTNQISTNLVISDNSTNESFFRIFQSADGGATYPTLVTTQNTSSVATASGAQTAFAVTGLSAGTTYYYRVIAYNEAGGVSSSFDTSVTTPAAVPFCGTRTVGPTGDYPSITAALNAVAANGLCGALLLELQAAYVSTVETFPINYTYSGASTVTIRPGSGATGRSITSANTTATFIINGGKNLTLDGRVNGAGSTADLLVANTSTSGVAIQFTNGATTNTVQYCQVQGMNTSTTSGVITFTNASAVAGGTSNNTIANNKISAGATTPTNLIYSSGSGTAGAANSANTINNNELFDFFNASSSASAINLSSTGNTGWTITNNSIYQTASRAFASASTHFGIQIGTGIGYTITGNSIGGTTAGAASGTLTLTGGRFVGIQGAFSTGTASTIQNNVIRRISLSTASGATGAPGIFTGIYVSAGDTNIGTTTGNTIGDASTANSITIAGSGAGAVIWGINNASAGANSISNNTVGNIAFTIANGIFNGIQASGNTVTATNNTIRSNSIITSGTSASTLYGYINGSSPTAETLTNNTIAGLSISGTSTATSHVMQGIRTTTVATDVQVFTGNTISGLAISSGSGTVSGIAFSLGGGPNSNIARNKIYDLSASGTSGAVNGIFIGGGGTYPINNNLIGNLTAPAATGANAVVGLNITGGTATNAYFNTIYLTGAGGATFGSSGISASTTPTVDLRNNLVVNNATPGSTSGNTVAYRRSGTGFGNYATTSNNNLFYAGTPAANRLIFFDGTNSDQTLAAYKTRMAPRDANSVTENPPFANTTTGAGADFLHIATGTATQVESGGVAVSGITTDFDGNTRNATPDIGADEGDFTPNDLTPPTITYTALANTASTGDRTLNVTITDASGVATGTGAPLIYFRKNGGAYSSAVATSIAGNVYTFTISAATLGGLTASDVVGYYVAAQDVNGNIATSPSGGSGITPPGSTAPGTPSSYTILNNLAGTYYVMGTATAGTSPAPTKEFATLTAAVAAYNSSGLGGAVTFELFSNTQGTETYPITINANADASATNTLTIKPSAGVVTTFTNTTTSSTLRLLSASYVTIDGSNTTGGTTRDLTLSNTSATATAAALVWVASTIAAPSTGVQIRNLALQGVANTVTSAGVMVSHTTYNTATGASANGVIIANNAIQGTAYGVVVSNDATTPGTGLQITSNLIGPATAAATANIGLQGIFVQSATSPSITGNTIRNVVSTTSSTYGINLSTGITGGAISNNTINTITGGASTYGINAAAPSLTVSGNTISNVTNTGSTGILYGMLLTGATNTVTSNIISNISTVAAADAIGLFLSTGFTGGVVNRNNISNVFSTNTGGYSGQGIRINTGSANSNLVLSNNFVSGITGYGYSSFTNDAIYGIGIQGITGGVKLYYNSINLSGSYNPSNINSNYVSAALYVASGATTLDIRNNIFANSLVNSGSSNKAYSLYSAAANTAFAALDYNDYFVSGSQAVFGGMNGADVANLAAFRTASGKDLNSKDADPTFNSATDLHTSAPALNGAATPITPAIAGVTDVDYDGQARNATTPDIGADEFTPAALDVAATALVAPSATGCYGATESVTVTVKNNATATLDLSVNPVTVTVNVTGAATQTLTQSFSTTPGGPTLAAGASANLTITSSTLNMSAAGTYTFAVTATTTGDGNSTNDALTPNVTRTNTATSALPQSVSFTGFTGANLTTLFPGWSEATGATTPTGSTSLWNNRTGLGGAGNITARINLFTVGKNEWILSPKMLATASTELSFKAGLTGDDVLTASGSGMTGTDDNVRVMVSTDCGVTYSPVYTFNAANQPANGSLGSYTVSLASYVGQSIIVGFLASEGTVDNTPDYDFHLDDILIRNVPAVDVKPTALTSPATTSSCYGAAVPVTVTVTNNGTSAIDLTTNPINLTVSVSGAATASLSGTLATGTLAVGASVAVSTSATLDMSAAGTYTFAITASATGDGDATNDVLTPNPTRTVTAPAVGTLSTNTTSVCNSGSITLSLNSSANGTAFVQQSADNTTFADVAGATLPYTATVTQTTYYRVQVRCGTSIATSNVVTITNTAPTVTVAPVPAQCGPTNSFSISATNSTTQPFPASVSGSNTTPSTIADNTTTGGAASTITLSGAGSAVVSATTRVRVTVNISHAYDQDLDIFLVGPGNTGAILLSSDNGGTGDNYTNTVFDTNATTVIGSTGNNTAPFTGTYRPEGTTATAPDRTSAASNGTPAGTYNAVIPAGALTGAAINGTWTLRAFDDASIDAGVLNNWTLQIDDPTIPTTSNFTTTITGPGTVGAVSYTGTPSGTTLGNTGASATVTDAPVGTNEYTITTTDPNGCATTVTRSVTVNPLPTASLTNSGPVCTGSSATATVTLGGSAGPWNLSYTVNGGTAVNLTNETSPVTITLAGPLTTDQTVQLTALTDAATGCAASAATLAAATTTILVYPVPTATLNATPAVCDNTPATISGTLNGRGPWVLTYAIDGANQPTETFGNSTQSTFNYSFNTVALTGAGTTKTISLVSLTSGGCTASSLPGDVSVTVDPAATVDAGPASASVCGGFTYTTTGTFGGSATQATYTTSGTGTFTNSGVIDAGNTSVTYTPSATDIAAGSVTLTLTSDDPAGACGAVADVLTLNITNTVTWTGTTDTDWFNGANWTSCGPPTAVLNAIIPSGTPNAPVIAGATAAANTLTVNSGAMLTQESGQLDLYGNLVNNGFLNMAPLDNVSMNRVGGALKFEGTASHSISGAGTFELLTLEINSGTTTTTLSSNLNVYKGITMLSGILNTGSSTIFLRNLDNTTVSTATLSEDATSYVLGRIQATQDLSAAGEVEFNGLGLALIPSTDAGADLPGLTVVTRTTGVVVTGQDNNPSIKRQYRIEPTVDENLNVAIDFGFFAHELNGIAESKLMLFSRSTSATGSAPWAPYYNSVLAVPAGATGLGVVSLGYVNHLSDWTLGSLDAPLPVELTRFTAVREGRAAQLSWATATEKNNRGFEVQVSANGRSFRTLGFVAGAGNSTAPRSYGFTDTEQNKQGLRYYRLKQVDLDGAESFSPVRTVAFGGNGGELAASFTAAPNPFSSELTLTVTATQASPAVLLTLTDAAGRTLLKQQVSIEAGRSEIALRGLGQLPAGLYLLHLPLDGKMQHVKVVKQ